MEMRDDELKVYYNGPLDIELDRAIEEALAQFGYHRWASGMEYATGVRDLAFSKGASEDAG